MDEKALTWSQKAVLTHLKQNGPSTGKELRDGCHQEDWRKRISELRAMGFNIADAWETGENEYGIPIRFKRYWIKESKS